MSKADARDAVLLAIKPEYAEAILSGRKKVEFRKRSFARSVSRVIVYASAPIQRVIGYFEIKFIESGGPKSIWSRFGSVGAIDSTKFASYYGARTTAVAIGVQQARRLERPLTLSKLGLPKTPPQSYSYVSWSRFERAAGVPVSGD